MKYAALNACIHKQWFFIVVGANAPACGRSPQGMLIGSADKMRLSAKPTSYAQTLACLITQQ